MKGHLQATTCGLRVTRVSQREEEVVAAMVPSLYVRGTRPACVCSGREDRWHGRRVGAKEEHQGHGAGQWRVGPSGVHESESPESRQRVQSPGSGVAWEKGRRCRRADASVQGSSGRAGDTQRPCRARREAQETRSWRCLGKLGTTTCWLGHQARRGCCSHLGRTEE